MDLSKRSPNLDLIRCVAVVCVLSVHYFLSIGFYGFAVIGKRMFCLVTMRTFFMVCVPLFLLLTGFLMNKKELSRRYYLGIVRTLVIYLLASAACIAVRAVYLGEAITARSAVMYVLRFNGAPYAWYIELYIGLFLLIPFLNLAYNGLKTQKGKLVLVGTLLALTVLPSVLNIWAFGVPGWWARPSISGDYASLVPDWWVRLYPITYYFLGAYICEFKPKLSKIKLLAAFLLAGLAFSCFNYYRSFGAAFEQGSYVDWGSAENTVTSVLLFLLLLQPDLSRMKAGARRALARIADLSLGVYLVSWIFDRIICDRIIAAVPDGTHRLEYFFVAVPLSFVLSLALSWVIDLIARLFLRRPHV